MQMPRKDDWQVCAGFGQDFSFKNANHAAEAAATYCFSVLETYSVTVEMVVHAPFFQDPASQPSQIWENVCQRIRKGNTKYQGN